MKKISWFTPQSNDASGERWYSLGYQNAALSTIQALNLKGVGVFFNKSDIPFHVNFCQPHYYQTVNEYTVGYTPWESTTIPEGWKIPMSLCNEVWATSNFVKDVYESTGIHEMVHVVPHGVSEEFKIIDREVVDTFNFIHVGGDSKRKNAQMAVDAFLENFDGNTDFKLILKSTGFANAQVKLNNRILPASQHPQIIGIDHALNVQDLVTLYSKAHCMVYPTSGEGFGMIPFEAICTGMPTIVTNLTGTADFAKMSIPLEASWEDADDQSEHYGANAGKWASPDFNQLINLMNHVVNEFDEFKKYTIQSAKILHERQSWASVADKILSRIEHFENL